MTHANAACGEARHRGLLALGALALRLQTQLAWLAFAPIHSACMTMNSINIIKSPESAGMG